MTRRRLLQRFSLATAPGRRIGAAGAIAIRVLVYVGFFVLADLAFGDSRGLPASWDAPVAVALVALGAVLGGGLAGAALYFSWERASVVEALLLSVVLVPCLVLSVVEGYLVLAVLRLL